MYMYIYVRRTCCYTCMCIHVPRAFSQGTTLYLPPLLRTLAYTYTLYNAARVHVYIDFHVHIHTSVLYMYKGKYNALAHYTYYTHPFWCRRASAPRVVENYFSLRCRCIYIRVPILCSVYPVAVCCARATVYICIINRLDGYPCSIYIFISFVFECMCIVYIVFDSNSFFFPDSTPVYNKVRTAVHV